MSPQELKSYLIHYYHKHKKGLTPMEVAFLKGSISYSEYLSWCYHEYCKQDFRPIDRPEN